MIRIWAFLAIVLFSVPIHAEPGPVGKWLMNEPVSMFTFGMAQLRQHVYGWKGTHPLAGVSIGVNYDWDENRITISLIRSEEPFDKEKCKQLLESARMQGGVYDGKLFRYRENSFYSDSFSPIGYVDKGAPKDYLKRIDEIIRIKVSFDGGGCEGRLVSSEILYRE